MSLNIRQRHIEAVVRMLNLNNPVGSSGFADGDVYKVLIIDKYCRDIISPLLKVNDLRRHGVTLHLMLDADRQAIPDVPAVYYVQASQANVQRIIQDGAKGLYGKMHVNFSASVTRVLLEELAAGFLTTNALSRIARIYDQYTEFVSLEPTLFSLGQPHVYLNLNDPTAQDKDVEGAVQSVVDGLFSVLATLGVVPIIRCPEKGPAEMVARQLDAKLRQHLVTPNNLFKEAAVGGAAVSGTGAGSNSLLFQRPLLCIFDRNFELAVGIQHAWAYRPLVHDVLGMKLNRVTLHQSSQASAASVLKGGSKSTSYELDSSDPFWAMHSEAPFQKAAEEVDGMLKKWKQDKEMVNKTGNGMEELDEDDILADNTKKLTAAMNAVPEMVERKRVIDKHITIGGRLLEEIKSRSLDAFFTHEDELLSRGSTDKAAMMRLLQGAGTPEDRIRLAVVFLLASDSPSSADVEAVEAALKEQDGDLAALHYIKQVKRLSSISSAASQYGGSKDDLLDWAGKLYGQSISRVTAGVKNLLAGGRQLAITRAMESLMDAKPLPETENFLYLDPRASKGTAASASARGPVKEAIAFMIGGGNFLEYGSLQEWAKRQQPPKTVVYGTTEMISPNDFIGQLADLGRKMGYQKPKQ